jgi:hypothetical protein
MYLGLVGSVMCIRASPRPARALVGGVASGPRRHSTPALQERSLSIRLTQPESFRVADDETGLAMAG